MARPRTPNNLRILKGTDKQHPERMRTPPEPKKGKIHPPTWLKPKARKAFIELAKITTDMNVLTTADKMSLAMVCDAYSDYLEANELVEKNGQTYVVTNREGIDMIKANPATTIKADAWRRVMIGLGKFGLSPSEREKINITPVKKKNPFDDD